MKGPGLGWISHFCLLPLEHLQWLKYSSVRLTFCRYKLKNIEETEAAKKLLQERRLVGRTKTELSIPSSYSADYFQRGRDYAEKLRQGCFWFLVLYFCYVFYVVMFFLYIKSSSRIYWHFQNFLFNFSESLPFMDSWGCCLLVSSCEFNLAEHPELYKGKNGVANDAATGPTDASNADGAGRRQAATDELMLERFRKRERHRVMRR